MFPKDQPISDERAVEAAQLGRSTQTEASPVNTGYYEPHKLADLNKYGRLYVIADGVSAPASGQIVSRYAIKKLLHSFFASDISNPQTRLQEVIRQVNYDIVERNSQRSQRRPMGTTLMAALLHNNKLFIANVGDSQAYVVWGQDIEQVKWDVVLPTPPVSDDAPVPLLPPLIKTPEPKKEASTDSLPQTGPQILGLDDTIKIDTFTRRLFPADIVILCSGGLTGYITEREITRAVGRHAPEQAGPRLIALAAERNNRDPVAISITRILSSAVALRPPGAMPLPNAPDWDNLDAIPKPSAPTSSQPSSISTSIPSPLPAMPTASTDTQPIMTPKAQSSQYSTTAQQLGQQRTSWRWRSCLLGLLVVLILCIAPIVIWRYVLTPDIVAAIPYLSNVEALLTEQTASLGLTLPTKESIGSEAAVQTKPTLETSPETPPNPVDTPTPAVETTLVVESVSPLSAPVSTPETIFNSPVSLPTATASPTPAQTPTSTPPSLPTIELPEGCTNRARFMRDVTIPDGAQFLPGEKFEKVWLLLNAETCPWGSGYTIRFLEGDPMGASPELPFLEEVFAKTNGEIRIPMVAPSAPGEYRGEWQLYDLAGEAFGPVMYLEIEVTQPNLADLALSEQTMLYDFIAKAGEATWSAGEEIYTMLDTDISDKLKLPAPQGSVTRGIGLLRGNVTSEQNVLLTYPHRELGLIEGSYAVDTSLQPTDALVAQLGFPKLSILSDDGVTFEVAFTPNSGTEQIILSKTVQYRDSPVTVIVPLTLIEPNQTGTFILRALGGKSLNQDWAVWIDLRLVRP